MILVGIDEAGLGPALGPLVMAATVFQTESPNLWGCCEAIFTKEPRKGSDSLWIGDSKKIHAKRGLAGLELPVLAYCKAKSTRDDNLESRSHLLKFLGCIDIVKQPPWFARFDQPAPVEVSREVLPSLLSILLPALRNAHVTLEKPRIAFKTANELNRMFDKGLNKSEVTQVILGQLMQSIASSFPDQTIHYQIDRQGGRTYYAPFLSSVFSGAWPIPQIESKEQSSYEILEGGRRIFIEFRTKADNHYLPVAYASMFAKYFRELAMLDFNRFFIEKLPDLKPTAGYHGDAKRYWESIQPILEAEGIPHDSVWRAR